MLQVSILFSGFEDLMRERHEKAAAKVDTELQAAGLREWGAQGVVLKLRGVGKFERPATGTLSGAQLSHSNLHDEVTRLEITRAKRGTDCRKTTAEARRQPARSSKYTRRPPRPGYMDAESPPWTHPY